MLFNSAQFMIFLPVVLLGYYLIPQRVRYLWLLGASYFFYGCWNVRYILLLFASTLITYLSALCVERLREKQAPIRWQKGAVGVSLVLNLGILFLFKYFNFGFEALSALAARAGVQLARPGFDPLLPVGISFYTFQALGYTLDVYRGQVKAEKNFFRYALFVSFFPQLVAGPIERSKNLLTQLNAPKKIEPRDVQEGIFLMLWGFFLKMVLADRITVYVDTVYGDLTTYTGWFLIVAAVLFSVQIYCDFAGYSIIAMGSAKLLGIQLMENFNAPYLSRSIPEFWRRWHISLSGWFRDYLYIPLGGNRKGPIRKNINLFIVFLVSGLWHGAAWTYLAWGGLHGLYLVLSSVTKPVRDKAVRLLGLHRETLGHQLLQTGVTFGLVTSSWILFRADSFSHAWAILNGILHTHNHFFLWNSALYSAQLSQRDFMVIVWGTLLLLLCDYLRTKDIYVHKLLLEQDWWLRMGVGAAAVVAILLLGRWGPAYQAANFIYFQF